MISFICDTALLPLSRIFPVFREKFPPNICLFSLDYIFSVIKSFFFFYYCLPTESIPEGTYTDSPEAVVSVPEINRLNSGTETQASGGGGRLRRLEYN